MKVVSDRNTCDTFIVHCSKPEFVKLRLTNQLWRVLRDTIADHLQWSIYTPYYLIVVGSTRMVPNEKNGEDIVELRGYFNVNAAPHVEGRSDRFQE